MQELEGRTAVITGGASGIGLAIAHRFARAGMNIVLADVEEPALDEAASLVAESGADVLALVTDVSDAGSMERLAAESLLRFGQVNVVCNNAGVAGGLGPGGWVDVADWKWVLDVNLWGVVHGHRVFLPHLLEHGEGHIVNTASMAGHFPGHSAYSASKWAVVGITEGLFHQLNDLGSSVGVSCLCPGWVQTRILQSDRNRPEWAAPPALGEPTPEAGARQQYVADQIASGVPTDQVADLVHDAVVGDQFWVFTDPAMVAALEPRYQAVLENRNPPTIGPGG
ncbi:MAG: SDR family NAD(P)-dependent oxidoreductase [Actinomycetia bacterium]|nr:SDR family NAD(P)-dependent oxidoreductase [Actinomycetes bacterium]